MTLTPILALKCVFFHFIKSLSFWMRCHQISSVPVCVELTEFLDNIFKMPIFKPKFTFLKFWKPIWLSIPRGLWPDNFFRYFDFKCPNHEKNYAWNIPTMDHNLTLNHASDQRVKETRPPFVLKKNWGLFSLTFLFKARFSPKLRIVVAQLFQA